MAEYGELRGEEFTHDGLAVGSLREEAVNSDFFIVTIAYQLLSAVSFFLTICSEEVHTHLSELAKCAHCCVIVPIVAALNARGKRHKSVHFARKVVLSGRQAVVCL